MYRANVYICRSSVCVCVFVANTEEIASGIAGGVAFVVIVVGLIIYRNWRYEQELDSLLWKIDYKDIQIPDLPTASSGQGKAPRVSVRPFGIYIDDLDSVPD